MTRVTEPGGRPGLGQAPGPALDGRNGATANHGSRRPAIGRRHTRAHHTTRRKTRRTAHPLCPYADSVYGVPYPPPPVPGHHSGVMNHATPQVGSPTGTFTRLLSSTRRGARLARLLTVTELHARGASRDLTERAELVVAELAADAALHGRVPGRHCFRLTLALDPTAGRLRVEHPMDTVQGPAARAAGPLNRSGVRPRPREVTPPGRARRSAESWRDPRRGSARSSRRVLRATVCGARRPGFPS